MKYLSMSFLLKHIVFILFLVFYGSIISYKLVSHPTPFYDWDESIYAQTGKEMVENKSLIPLWQHQPWLEKPPLAPLLYGAIIKYAPGIPEVSTRLFSLGLSIIALILIYLWTLRVVKNKWIALLTSVLTAFNPIFLQRSQNVNTDSLLLIGWLGYILTFPRLYTSLFFLFLGVFSKSLLGFYPVCLLLVFEIYKYLTKQNKQKELNAFLKTIIIQCGILSLWYLLMIGMYKYEFIQVHFTDHLLRRVTSSIESHFGQRTFYLDLVVEQYGYLLLICFFSLFLFLKDFLKKKIDVVFWGLFLLPWFLFLNLTKTKISWYIYPSIPEFAFLLAYPLSIIKNRKVISVLCILLSIFACYWYITNDHFFSTYYSKYDNVYKLATAARDNCTKMTVIQSPDDRKTYETLKSLHLTISTTTTYGSNPSYFYYFGKPIALLYQLQPLNHLQKTINHNECFVINNKDIVTSPEQFDFKLIQQFGDSYLYLKK